MVGALFAYDGTDQTRALLEPATQGVFVRLSASESAAQAFQSVVLSIGDDVHTDAVGRAVITYADGTAVGLEPGAELVIAPARHKVDLLALVRDNAARLWSRIAQAVSAAARYEGSAGTLAAVVRAGSVAEGSNTPEGVQQVATGGARGNAAVTGGTSRTPTAQSDPTRPAPTALQGGQTPTLAGAVVTPPSETREGAPDPVAVGGGAPKPGGGASAEKTKPEAGSGGTKSGDAPSPRAVETRLTEQKKSTETTATDGAKRSGDGVARATSAAAERSESKDKDKKDKNKGRDSHPEGNAYAYANGHND